MRLNWLRRRSTKKTSRRVFSRPRLERLEDRLAPATFTVGNTFSSGPGSLDQGVADANANPGLDTVAFNIPGSGVHTIHPATDLPVITDAVIIDGYTQPGASPNTLAFGDNAVLEVEIDCSAIDNTLFFFSGGGGSTVRGLVINHQSFSAFDIGPGFGFPSDNNTIAGNFIGTDAAGAAYQAGGNNGIRVVGSGNTIGGPAPADRNVIVAGSSGTERMIGEDGDAHGTHVQGNYLGVNAAGTTALNAGNPTQAMFPGSSSKGGDLIEDNVIVTSDFAIQLESNDNVVRDNLIGTNATGTAGLGGGRGVVIASGNASSNHNTIAGNLISGGTTGIQISTSPSFPVQGLVIQGNKIGTDIKGKKAIPNSSDGIDIIGEGGATIGGANPGEGNIIAFNGGVGVFVTDSATTGYAISGNSIFANGGLGIDLSGGQIPDGVTPNDTGDADSGPNGLQNYPVLTSVRPGISSTTITGRLNSTPNATYRIEFFASNAADPSGFGEGQFFRGAITTNPTDANGDVGFTATLPATVGAGQAVTATATDPAGNTSEFSQLVTVPGSATHLSVKAPASSVAGKAFTFTVTAFDARNHPAVNYRGTIHFTSSDPSAVLPADYTFTAADVGVHTFSATLKTAGSKTITATDTLTATITGQATVSVQAAAVAKLSVVPLGSQFTAGVPFSVSVTALDAFNNVVPGYRGTVHFTSTDAGATLPGDYTFVAADKGVHTFQNMLIFQATGQQTITVRDQAHNLTGRAQVIIQAPVAKPRGSVAPAGWGMSADRADRLAILDAFYAVQPLAERGVFVGG
jgi:hypothetical protein